MECVTGRCQDVFKTYGKHGVMVFFFVMITHKTCKGELAFTPEDLVT